MLTCRIQAANKLAENRLAGSEGALVVSPGDRLLAFQISEAYMLRQIQMKRFSNPLRTLIGGLFALAFTVTVVTSPAGAADSDPGAMRYVQQMSDNAYNVLNREDLNEAQKAEVFRNLVKASFDFRRIGMFALAKHRRQASKDDVVHFLKVFEEYAINIYQSRLGEYSGERLRVKDSLVRRETSKAREIIVQSEVIFADGSQPWPVNWRVFARDGRYQVVDVQVAGVWMAMEQRSQFSSIIVREKGSLAALTKILQIKASATADL